jgi:copper transport protein
VRVILHATLLHSVPASKSQLSTPPESIRLVFSEGVVPELSQISVRSRAGAAFTLSVATDPHDVHVLIGRVTPETFASSCAAPPCNEEYTVSWRVVSADGHPVSGTFSFDVTQIAVVAGTNKPVAAGGAAKEPAADTAPATGGSTMSDDEAPLVAAFLRGLGITAMMGGVGLLFFAGRAADRQRVRGVETRFVAVGFFLLLAQMIAWLIHISPDQTFQWAFVTETLSNRIGAMELVRTVAALLTLWAIALARREKIALVFGILCLMASGAIGHPAALHSGSAIPAKILHLLSGSLWLGGLLWLAWVYRTDASNFVRESRRVSRFALVAVVLVAFSGVNQTFLFLNTPSDLIHSSYGALVLCKVAGLLILVALGAYNRYRLIPALDSKGGSIAARKLSQSVRQELAIMAIVIVIGSFLSYEPTPPISGTSALQVQRHEIARGAQE